MLHWNRRWVVFATLSGMVGLGIAPLALPGAGVNDRTNDALAAGKGAAPAKKKRRNPDTDLVTVLYRVGLQPEHLAAGGVAPDQTTAVVAAMRDWMAQNPTAFADADARWAKATFARDSIVRKVQSGLASQEEIASCEPACTEFTAAKANLDAVIDGALRAATASLSPQAVALLTTIRTNRLTWSLPFEFDGVERTQQDWVTLREALDNERIATNRHEEPDADFQRFLSTARADPVVAAARTNLDTRLGGIQEAWDAATEAR